jgi:RHS repeat-associated protein
MTACDIYTIAGNPSGTCGNTGDNGAAAQALLQNPAQVAVDSSGNLYIADSGNNRVQEIAGGNGTQWAQQMTAGDIYTVAGSPTGQAGQPGPPPLDDPEASGDGGPGRSALIDNAVGVAVDASGDLLIPDYYGNTLRELVATANSPFPVSPQATGVTVNQPGGAQVTFYPQSAGSCTAPYVAAGSGGYCALPQDVGATLSYSSANGGTYTFSPSPGATYTYTSQGPLTSESDAAGDTLAIAYGSPAPGSGNCPSTAGWCQTVTSASGRVLTIGYNSSGFVTSVTDPMGREWAYSYAGSDLTSATDPMGNKTTYTYGAGSTGNPLNANNLLTITSPNAQPGGPDTGADTVIAYNAAGQATSVTDPMGDTTTINYCMDAAAGDCMNAATGSGDVTVTYPDQEMQVENYTQGVLTAHTGFNGQVPSEEDVNPSFASAGGAGGTLLPLSTSNADNEVSAVTYNSSGQALSTTDPLGNVSTMWPTTLGGDSCATDAEAASPCSSTQTGPAPVAPGGIITPPSSVPPAGVTYSLYDTDGNDLYDTTGVYEPGSDTAAYAQTTYTLYKGNTVTLNGKNISCSSSPPTPSMPCAEIDASDVVTQLEYYPSSSPSVGLLESESVPDGNGSELATTTYSYDNDGEQTSAISPDGNVTGANPGNYTTVSAYNADGMETSETDAGGAGATITPRTTSYGYDADGNQVSVTGPRGFTTRTAYNADDLATTITDADGNETLNCYNGIGAASQTVPPAGVAANNLTASSCPASYPAGYSDRLASDATISTYNSAAELASVSTPAPPGQTGIETTTYTYDPAGQLTETSGPPASTGGPDQVTYSTYDADGDVLTTTDGYGTSSPSTVAACYDPNGDQTAVVAADGNTSGTATCEQSYPWVVSSSSYPAQAKYQTTSSYDSADELVSTTTPATTAAPQGATTTTSYDPDGDPVSTTSPNEVTTTMTFPVPGGPVGTVSYSGSSAHSVSNTYDAEGNLTSMTDGTGTSTYSVDPFGELTSATNGAGQAVTYAYDADGDTTGITYPLPSSATWAATDTVSYGYDHADVLTSVTDFSNHKITITPNANEVPASETLGSSGDTISYTYNAGDYLSGIALANSTSTLQSFTYKMAPDGSVTSETDAPSSQSSATYTYDPLGQIASMTQGNNNTLSYAFDPSGNLTALPSQATGSYDYAGELTSAVTGSTTTSYTYDPAGDRLTATQGSATIASAGWNGAGQLASYSNPASDMTSAAYDGNGYRTAETTASGTQDFTWGAGSDLLMDSANAYIYTGSAAPAEQVNLSTGAVTYLNQDALGSVRGVVSSSGALTATTSYDAWGNPMSSGGLASYTPFGFAGGYTDPTGLIYLLNRYYDPSTGAFLSVDPDLSETGEPYGYAGGDPADSTDPSGMSWQIAIPSVSNGWIHEDSFEGWVNAQILGGEQQYRIYKKGAAGLFRGVDIYYEPHHWLNEMKVGAQQLTTNRNFNEHEVNKDKSIILDSGTGEFTHAGKPVIASGGTWWFGYKPRGCQRTTQNRCANEALRDHILNKNPDLAQPVEMNIVYVWYYKGECGNTGFWNCSDPSFNWESLYGNYTTAVQIANALTENSCPLYKLTRLRLPISEDDFHNPGAKCPT